MISVLLQPPTSVPKPKKKKFITVILIKGLLEGVTGLTFLPELVFMPGWLKVKSNFPNSVSERQYLRKSAFRGRGQSPEN